MRVAGSTVAPQLRPVSTMVVSDRGRHLMMMVVVLMVLVKMLVMMLMVMRMVLVVVTMSGIKATPGAQAQAAESRMARRPSGSPVLAAVKWGDWPVSAIAPR